MRAVIGSIPVESFQDLNIAHKLARLVIVIVIASIIMITDLSVDGFDKTVSAMLFCPELHTFILRIFRDPQYTGFPLFMHSIRPKFLTLFRI